MCRDEAGSRTQGTVRLAACDPLRVVSMALGLALLLGTLAVPGHSETLPPWAVLLPGMAEAQVARIGGKPHSAQIEIVWDEWRSVRRTRQDLAAFPFIYCYHSTTEGYSKLLGGPFGPATEVRVQLVRGRVFSVSWTYEREQFQPAWQRFSAVRRSPLMDGGTEAVGEQFHTLTSASLEHRNIIVILYPGRP